MSRSPVIAVLALVGVILFLPACERQEIDPHVIAQDLRHYLEAHERWERSQREVFQAIRDVEKNHYVDDEFVAKRLGTAHPVVQTHAVEIEQFEPRTHEIRKVHELYQRGWDGLEAGFSGVIAAMEKRDYEDLAKAKRTLDANKERVLAAFRRLNELIMAYEPQLEALERNRPQASGIRPQEQRRGPET